jgi:dTDP-4-amino-4,6-dideoxygalactose transaminase
VLADCLDTTGLVDPHAVAEALTARTRAVIAVHLYGQPADMRGLEQACRAREIPLLEDAAQAHGARLEDGRRCGALGLAAGFSFYPSKNLGAAGDGGAITTSDPELARRLRSLRNWGAEVKYEHRDKGWNSRLDTIQAALLRVKLRHLDGWNAGRARAAGWYRERLAELPGVVCLEKAAWTGTHAYHLFVVRIAGLQDRNAFLSRLAAAGVEAGIHYPRAVHQQPAYAELGAAGAFPVAERLCREIISLPMFPEITEGQVDHVVSALRSLV